MALTTNLGLGKLLTDISTRCLSTHLFQHTDTAVRAHVMVVVDIVLFTHSANVGHWQSQTLYCPILASPSISSHPPVSPVTPPLQDDEFTHLYTLIVRPDNTYEVKIDNKHAEGGILEEDWDFLPPKTIPDPEARKPEDWDDTPKIDDPEDTKPEVGTSHFFHP